MASVFAKLLWCDSSVSLTQRSTYTGGVASLPPIVSSQSGGGMPGGGGGQCCIMSIHKVCPELGWLNTHSVGMETAFQPVYYSSAFPFPYDSEVQRMLGVIYPTPEQKAYFSKLQLLSELSLMLD